MGGGWIEKVLHSFTGGYKGRWIILTQCFNAMSRGSETAFWGRERRRCGDDGRKLQKLLVVGDKSL
jgi:hypothetical protein